MTFPDHALSPDSTGQELTLPDGRKQAEQIRIRLYESRQDEFGLRQWLFGSLTCDEILLNETDILSNPQPLLATIQPNPAKVAEIFFYINQVKASLVEKVKLNEGVESDLFFHWLKYFFIRHSRIVDDRLNINRFATLWHQDNLEQLGLKPRHLYSSTKRLSFHKQWRCQTIDRKNHDRPFSDENLHHLAELDLSEELMHAYNSNDTEPPSFRQIILKHVIKPTGIIRCLFLDPNSFIITYYYPQQKRVYPYFSYSHRSGETAFAPGFTGPEKTTPPAQLAHTIADFYLAEN